MVVDHFLHGIQKLEFAGDALLVERHGDNLGGLSCGQVNCDSPGGLLGTTQAGDPGDGLFFSHIEHKRGRQRFKPGFGGLVLDGKRLLRILDIGRNELPARAIEVGALLLLGVLAHECQFFKIRLGRPAVGRVNDEPEITCRATLEADALRHVLLKGRPGAETIGTLQFASIELGTPRGKRTMIRFNSLRRGDALHANGQVGPMIRCQLHPLDERFPHVHLKIENLLTVGIEH